MKQKALHIFCKELQAVYHSLRSFKIYFQNKQAKIFSVSQVAVQIKMYFQNKQVKIFSDSQLAVQVISKIGTTKSSICKDILKNIWLFCVKNKIWITAAYIPGAENVIPDYKLRKSYKDVEWILNPDIFQKVIKHLKSKPDFDRVVSRLNTQLPKYISNKPDPYAYLIDAF